MNILIVHNKEINHYPPVKSLVDIMIELGHKITLVCYDEFGYANEKNTKVNCEVIRLNEYKKSGRFSRIINIFCFKKNIRTQVSKLMNENDLIWTTTDNTISLLGRELLKHRIHVMQLMELVDDAPIMYYNFLYKLKLNRVFTVNLEKYARRASHLVVPEINRAYIVKAMWNLDKLPTVLPNKPYKIEVNEPNQEIKDLIDKLTATKKKLILYQGIFLKERKLDEFAEAIDKLGSEYAFCIMGRDREERRRLCKKYPNIIYIPFIAPPLHLLITQIAYVGVLTYFPEEDYSLPGKLNVLYCAPNKIYEYAYSELPMIGNNIPGLATPFEKYNIGKCFDELDSESIVRALKDIESEYEEMKQACKSYYNSVDMKAIVKKVLSLAPVQ